MLTPNLLLQNRYRIERLLAQGGMGAVYEAIDENLGIRVALKQRTMLSTLAQHAFRQEARLLARLTHPALPRVTDYFTTSDQEVLVMEYIPGPDLGEELAERNAPFRLGDVLNWADQLLDALQYLHGQTPTPIFHRDIKPQNLKRRQRNGIALLDFGIAKGSLADMTQITNAPSVMAYTRGFAPLEQIDGLGTDARTDLYSLAATLYKLLTNVGPADATTRDRATARQLPDPLQPLHVVNAEVPPALSAVLMQALALDPDDRPPSAEAMRRAIHAAMQEPRPRTQTAVVAPDATVIDTPTVAPAVATEVARQVATGNPAADDPRATPREVVPQPNVTPQVVLDSQPRIEPQPNVQRREPPPPAQPIAPRRRSRWPWIAGAALLVALVGGGSFMAYSFMGNSAAPTPTTQGVALVDSATPTDQGIIDDATPTDQGSITDDTTPTTEPTTAPTEALAATTPLEVVPTVTTEPTPQPTNTVAPTPEPSPTVTASRGRIAFYSQRDGLAEIYSMNADGSNQTRLTDNDAVDWDPDWSPSGQQIAFNSNRDGSGDVYIMNADGSGQTRVTTHPGDDGAPDWSPDGQQIAFMSFRNGEPNIYVINADGTGETRLTDTFAIFPNWSPDGHTILFASDRDGDREIYVMDADGSNQTRLTESAGADDNPQWSADGLQILFKSERDGQRDVYVMKRDGTEQTRLTAPRLDGFAPAWSPDNDQIAFQSSRDGGEEIYVMDADGSNPVRLTENANEISDGEPSWTR